MLEEITTQVWKNGLLPYAKCALLYGACDRDHFMSVENSQTY